MNKWIKKQPCTFNDQQLVEEWLSMHREFWFNNPTNGFHGHEQRAREIAEYWMLHRKHGPDNDCPTVILLMKYWDEYVEMFTEVQND